MVTIARIHGRNGIAYVGIAPAAAASPVAFLNSWTINFVVAKADVTAFGDPNMVYVAGLPDANGDFAGFYDNASAQTYTSATDGVARNFYLYPSTLLVTQYFFGTILPDFSVTAAVGSSATVKSTWAAASSISKVG